MTSMNISNECIKKIENLPNSLTEFNCTWNKIKIIENLPLTLRYFGYYSNPIKFVDNVPINQINFTLRGYSSIKRIQLRMKRRYHFKNEAAKVIQKAAWNWLNKAICSDNTYGINFDIGIKRLQEDNLVPF